MTKMIEKTGDMFTTTAPAIGHGVNVRGLMLSGVAKIVAERHPQANVEYMEWCRNGSLLPGGIHVWEGDGTVLYNIASQDNPGASARLDWLDASVRAALDHADAHGITAIALPRIGCGIGGLDWVDVKPLLEAAAADYNCDLEVWAL